MAWRLSTGTRNGLLNLAANGGGGLAELLKAGIIRIYSGTQPASADDAVTGTLLCTITGASLPVTQGVETNGLGFAAATGGVIGKDGVVWSGDNIADGTAGWARFSANATLDNTGISTTAVRVDMAAATSGSQINFSTTSLVNGITTTVSSVAITQPAA